MNISHRGRYLIPMPQSQIKSKKKASRSIQSQILLKLSGRRKKRETSSTPITQRNNQRDSLKSYTQCLQTESNPRVLGANSYTQTTAENTQKKDAHWNANKFNQTIPHLLRHQLHRWKLRIGQPATNSILGLIFTVVLLFSVPFFTPSALTSLTSTWHRRGISLSCCICAESAPQMVVSTDIDSR